MHPAAAQALFEEEAHHLSAALAARRSWTLHAVAYPLIDCSFSAPGRTTLRLKLACDDWNDLPPSITLLAADGSPLQDPSTLEGTRRALSGLPGGPALVALLQSLRGRLRVRGSRRDTMVAILRRPS